MSDFVKKAEDDLKKELHQTLLNIQEAEQKLSEWQVKLDMANIEERRIRDFMERVERWKKDSD